MRSGRTSTATTLTIMKSCWWRRAEPLFVDVGAHLQVGLDGPNEAEPKVRVLAMTKGAPSTFRSVVGRFPSWVVEERTESAEMVHVQMSLLATERRDLGCLTISLPGRVAPLRFIWTSASSLIVFPDGEPGFQKGARHTKLTSDRTRHQFAELLPFVGGQVLSPMHKQGAVQPQVFPDLTELVPIAPGDRRWFNDRQHVGRTAHFRERRSIGWRELEPLTDRAVVHPELPGNGASGRDVLAQLMDLGDAQCVTR